MALQDKQQSLVIEELSVVFDFMFGNVIVKLFNFFEFVVVMFDLSEIEKSVALFSWL